MFIDTLGELFTRSEALFSGLAVHNRWYWGRRLPVIRLSFAEGVLRDRAELDRRILDLLRIHREDLGVTVHPNLDSAAAFGELIRRAHAQYGERVVVLVDEYDGKRGLTLRYPLYNAL